MIAPAVLIACGDGFADDYYQQMSRLKALDRRCEEARAKQLAPLRKQFIQECMQDRHKTAQECQGEAMAYGEPAFGPSGRTRGLYYDLPECQQAAQAWQEWEASRPGVR